MLKRGGISGLGAGVGERFLGLEAYIPVHFSVLEVDIGV